MERENKDKIKAGDDHHQKEPSISAMKAVTRDAYGGGMYAPTEKGGDTPSSHPPASQTQSADGPDEAAEQPKHKAAPPSSGDRDIDITGQSYIQ